MNYIARGLFLLLACVLSFNVTAQDSLLRDDIPERYIVKTGDTLWDISKTFLKTPWHWPEVWHLNPQINNPHLIFPGDVISLIYIDGRPLLTVDRTLHLTPLETRPFVAERVRPKIREQVLSDAIPAIPLDQINSFLSRSRVVDQGVLEAAPYVVSGQESRLILGVGDRLYARGQFADTIPSYGIYRRGENYIDPETEEILGVEALDVGAANIGAIDGDIATLSITRSTRDVRIGDRIMPSAYRLIEPTFFPSAPATDINGHIISVEGGVSQVAMLDVIAINRGIRDKISVGNVLNIFKSGEVIEDPLVTDPKARRVKLPDEHAGLLMVFQTFEKMSLAIVLEADRGIRVGDLVRNP
ncbi:MAG: LysM peptidoglycan-binding domain-containing protein [Cellvibrionaceae bacterium]|nr:LysM peptidoglycan-binding domain-containing protein [Cellvibrionaceae bacterium]